MRNRRLRTLLAVVGLAAGAPTLLPFHLHAQEVEEPARNSAYVELLGNGLLYSLNYDRKFTDNLSGRVGLMTFGAVAVPVMGNYLAGSGSHRLELGAGPMLIFAGDVVVDEEVDGEIRDSSFLFATATFGYRYQPVNGGFVFRIGATPVIGGGGGIPWAGMSFGYAFR